MTSSKPYRAIVKCPFCGISVDSRELADHARLSHVTEEKNATLQKYMANVHSNIRPEGRSG